MKGGPHLIIGAACGLALAGGPEHVQTGWPVLVASAIGALAPDLDHQNSMGSRWLDRLFVLPGRVVLAGLLILMKPLLLIAAVVVGLMVLGRLDQRQLAKIVLQAWQSITPEVADALVPALAALVGLVVLSWLANTLMPWRFVEHRGPFHWLLAALMAGTLSAIVAALVGQDPLLGLAFGLGWLSHLVADSPTMAGMPLFEPFWTPHEHQHFRRAVRILPNRQTCDVLEPYGCRMVHLTPRRLLFVPLRWHSGNEWVERLLAIAAMVAALALTHPT